MRAIGISLYPKVASPIFFVVFSMSSKKLALYLHVKISIHAGFKDLLVPKSRKPLCCSLFDVIDKKSPFIDTSFSLDANFLFVNDPCFMCFKNKNNV